MSKADGIFGVAGADETRTGRPIASRSLPVETLGSALDLVLGTGPGFRTAALGLVGFPACAGVPLEADCADSGALTLPAEARAEGFSETTFTPAFSVGFAGDSEDVLSTTVFSEAGFEPRFGSVLVR